MPDITMCGGFNDELGECPRKKQCYRHEAKPSHYQSYFMQAPIKIAEDNTPTCDYFWDKDIR